MFQSQRGEPISIRYSQDNWTAMHSHDFLELVYVLEGQAVQQLGKDICTLQAGDYFLIDYDRSHSYTPVTGQAFRIVNYLFLPEFIDASLRRCRSFREVITSCLFDCDELTGVYPANEVFHDRSGAIRSLILRSCDEYRDAKPGYLSILRSYLIEIIVLAIRESGATQPLPRDHLSAAICREVDGRYREHDLLGSLAREKGYSVSGLSRRFAAETGMSFLRYLQRTRVRQACKMIRSGTRIAAAAEAVGYSDLKFFYRVFRHEIGMTPAEYRKIAAEHSIEENRAAE